MADLGPINNYNLFEALSHNWAGGMNANMLKAATTLHLSVKGIVSELPPSPAPNDTYILSGTRAINVFANGTWNTIAPVAGTLAFVEDDEAFYLYDVSLVWMKVFSLDEPITSPVERNLSFFAPGLVRPNNLLFHYIPTMEFVLPAGAPNSFATLEVPPSGGDLVLTITALLGSGTITFEDGETDGVFSVPNDITVLPADFEELYSQPQVLRIYSSGNHGAEGLSVSLKGQIRAID